MLFRGRRVAEFATRRARKRKPKGKEPMAKGKREKPCAPSGRLVVPPLLLLIAWARHFLFSPWSRYLYDLQPRGGQRGKTFTLTIKGEGLAAGADLITSLPCTVTKLAPRPDSEMPESELAYLIHVP